VLMTLLCGLLIALYMLMLFRQRRRSLADEA
jgi:multiple sugar transport system permease protein